MKTTTKNGALKLASILLLTGFATACDEERAGDDAAARDDVADASRAVAQAPAASGASLDLERIMRRVERGEASRGDVAALAKIVEDAQVPADELDRASLGLSKALEATGDQEGAIRAIEALLKRHGHGDAYDFHDEARARLRLLLTGTEDEPPSYARNMEPMAPIAKALVPHFPEDERGATLVDVLSIGRPPTTNDPHGMLNIRAAKRAIEEAACSICDVDVKASVSHSRIDSWLSIPGQSGERRAEMPNPDRSLLIVHFDLVQNRVPSRYDAYLAVPSDETVARLERGEGFVAFRERPGKKPLVLLAAPRAAQLDDVEKAFAEMTSLPTEPVAVDVHEKLFPHEIQGIVRSGFGAFRACYEKVLAVDPKAAGNVKVKFSIDGQGVPHVGEAESTLTDPNVGRCVADAMGKLRFPVTGEKVDVTYPIAFSPG